MESTGNAADTDFISKKKRPRKENTGIEGMSQEENLVFFFSLGAGKKPPPLAFQLVENSHLLSLLPFPSSECPHGAEH